MNQQIKDNLLWRATIVENSESLIKSCSRNNKAQLSLFAETESETIDLNIPKDVDYEKLLQREVDVLGISLTYNIQDKYILQSKRFCNTTLRDINELTESKAKLVFIAKINDIEYRVSSTGNNYAKIFWRDYNSATRMYLFGDMYQKLISKAFKGQYYLCEALYNKDKESMSIVNFKAIDDIKMLDNISTIILDIKDAESIVQLRQYVFSKMIGSQYNLVFKYKNGEFIAPYKINFTEENYCDIKEFINDLTVKK